MPQTGGWAVCVCTHRAGRGRQRRSIGGRRCRARCISTRYTSGSCAVAAGPRTASYVAPRGVRCAPHSSSSLQCVLAQRYHPQVRRLKRLPQRASALRMVTPQPSPAAQNKPGTCGAPCRAGCRVVDRAVRDTMWGWDHPSIVTFSPNGSTIAVPSMRSCAPVGIAHSAESRAVGSESPGLSHTPPTSSDCVAAAEKSPDSAVIRKPTALSAPAAPAAGGSRS